jgi:uncharacterized membrane protein YhaH (DUF805 family)
MADTYDLRLTGSTLPDRSREPAATALAAVMRITPEQALKLLSGRETIIKRNLGADQVPRYLRAIEAAGVEVRAERTAPPSRADEPLALIPLDDAATVETVVCPACGTEQPKRNLCRQCGTDMPRLLAAKEEAQRDPPAQSPFAPPTAMVRDVAAARTETETPSPLAFSFQGRIGRLRYLAYFLPAYVPMLIGALIGGFFAGIAHSMVGFTISFGIGALVTMALALRVAVLRLHDINRTGWWLLAPLPLGIIAAVSNTLGIALLVLFAAVFSLALLFWPGSSEDNDYGSPPGENTVWTTVGAIVMILFWIGSNVLSPMAKFGAKAPIGTPVSERSVR